MTDQAARDVLPVINIPDINGYFLTLTVVSYLIMARSMPD